MAFRIAAASVLRAHVVDIESALARKAASPSTNVHILGAKALDATHRSTMIQRALARVEREDEEHLLVLPRQVAAEVFGSEVGVAALEAGPKHLLPEPSQGMDSAALEAEPTHSLCANTAGNELAMSSSALALVEAPAMSLMEVASALQGESNMNTLQREAPPCVTRTPPQLPPQLQRVFAAAATGSRESLRDVLDSLGDLDLDAAHPEHGGSCLHVAASSASDEMAAECVAELCERGADVNARAKNASTPLHWAAGAGNVSTAKELLRFGADASISSYTWRSNVFGKGSGQTPAHWAAESGHEHVIEALLEHDGIGALSPFAVDERGVLPVDLARKEGHYESLAALEDASQCEMVCISVSREAFIHRVLPAE
eukprot:TRINITY_DN27516_c0_g1_i1.p1 TRINITY_DN27516_c0_g1~~TRINITY_DN27516_c0_g1_i1.p1  ORF type:complete len:393 (-),score=59.58 TRINITY_DN27516_c0_g1_i1:206-1324(-)